MRLMMVAGRSDVAARDEDEAVKGRDVVGRG
jgi:hypothetical protein